jgi:uracil-DNA glycosylase family 4
MISIKKSFAQCNICPLLGESSCILDTNIPEDLTQVEVIFIAENPGKDEIAADPPTPLIGKAGKIFRYPFNIYIKDKFKWLISNCVLCATIKDNKTGNPDDEVIEICKENIFNIVRICKPKLIVLMGMSPVKAFGIDNGKSQLSRLRGKFYKWEDVDVLITFHPSYMNYASTRISSGETKNNKDLFHQDIQLTEHFLSTGEKELIQKEEKINVMKKQEGIFSYRIPDKYYTEDYTLIDVQYLNKDGKVIFIFRDKDNQKVFFTENDNYYFYKCDKKDIEKRHTLSYEHLTLNWTTQREKQADPNEYESDMKITAKHACDYYMQREVPERDVKLKILYVDLEIYSGDYDGFPDPVDADHMICLATFELEGKVTTYTVKHNDIKEKIDILNGDVVILKDEYELMTKIVEVIRESDYDILTAWNLLGFDLIYIYNRCQKLGINPNKMSKFGNVYVDKERLHGSIPGIICLDLLLQYKSSTFTTRENYRLNTIANYELGEEKITMEDSFNNMYRNHINKYIEYNRKDVTLLSALENKLGYLKLQNEIRRICKTSFDSSLSAMGQIHSLFTSYLKEQGLSCRNSVQNSKEKISGAYVKEPIPGIYEWFVDFDYTSLYPSLILTYNLGINTFVFKFVDPKNGYLFAYDKEKLPNEIEVIYDPTYKKQKITIEKDKFLKRVEEEGLICTINGCFYKNHNKEQSYFATILEMLLSSRKVYKKKMFEEKTAGNHEKATVYDTWQLVYKVLANACYGVLLNKHFRFFNPDIGRSITISGEELTKMSIVSANNFIKSLIKKEDVKYFNITYSDILADNELSQTSPYVITSDTDSVFVSLDELVPRNIKIEEQLDIIHKLCDQTQNYLNNDMVIKLVQRHNVSIEKNKLSLKNELVCRSGLFVAKKMYAIYVIEQELKRVDEINVKGLEIRRGDYPQYTKQKLSELIDIILKSEKISISNIQTFVQTTKEEIRKLILDGDPSIARPVSFTKKLSEYIRIPPNVIGMQMWNTLVNNVFVPGTKGYMFKIFGVDKEKLPIDMINNYEKIANKKLDAIVMPSELSKLPDYFIIDLNANLKFAWVDRCNHLLASIMEVKEKEDIIYF